MVSISRYSVMRTNYNYFEKKWVTTQLVKHRRIKQRLADNKIYSWLLDDNCSYLQVQWQWVQSVVVYLSISQLKLASDGSWFYIWLGLSGVTEGYVLIYFIYTSIPMTQHLTSTSEIFTSQDLTWLVTSTICICMSLDFTVFQYFWVSCYTLSNSMNVTNKSHYFSGFIDLTG